MDREGKRARCAYGQGQRPAPGLGNSMEEVMTVRLTSRGRVQTDPAELAAGYRYTARTIYRRSGAGSGCQAGWSCSLFSPLRRFSLLPSTGHTSSVPCRTCCSSCVPYCICSCMAGTAADMPATGRARIDRRKEVHDACRHAGLWPLAAGGAQLGRLHHLCAYALNCNISRCQYVYKGGCTAIPAHSLAASCLEVHATVGERFYHRF